MNTEQLNPSDKRIPNMWDIMTSLKDKTVNIDLPEKNPEQIEEDNQKRQGRKIIASITRGDNSIILQSDVELEDGEREEFNKRIRLGLIDASSEEEFLLNIRPPLFQKNGLSKLEEKLNSKHYQRILGITLHGTYGFYNYSTLNRARSIKDFMSLYPTPLDYQEKCQEILDIIKGSNSEAKYQEYVTDMERFQHIIYGKRYEYYKAFNRLIEQAMQTNNITELTDSEKNSIIKHAKVDGDPFLFFGRKYQLDISTLQNLGLEPQVKQVIDGVEIDFSKSFRIDSRDAIIGYTKKGDNYIARSYYKSRSQGIWRYLPDYRTNGDTVSWYGKAYSEEMLNLPAEIQASLSTIADENPLQIDVADATFAFVGTAKAYYSEHDYLSARYSHTLRGDLYQEVDARPSIDFGEIGEYEPPEKLTVPDEYWPDLDRETISWESDAELYGHLTNRVYVSKNKEIKYTISEDDQGRAFISNMELSGPITSTGVRKNWIKSGCLGTPLYEYARQDGGYGDSLDMKGSYRCMWKNYLSKTPIIRAYLDRNK